MQQQQFQSGRAVIHSKFFPINTQFILNVEAQSYIINLGQALPYLLNAKGGETPLDDTHQKPFFTLISHPASESVHTVFSLRCGYCFSRLATEGAGQPKTVNQAFAYVLACLIKNQFPVVHINLLHGATSIYFRSPAGTFGTQAEALYDALYNQVHSLEDFSNAKAIAVQEFKNSYSNALVRAMFHMTEYTDSQKQFSFVKFAQDIQNIGYDEYIRLKQMFVFPTNTQVVVMASEENLALVQKLNLALCTPDVSRDISYFFLRTAPELQQDLFKVLKDVENRAVGCLKFYTETPGVTPADLFFVLNIVGEILFETDYETSVDYADASIVYWGKEAKQYKFNLQPPKPGVVQRAVARLLVRLHHEMDNNPKLFTQKYGALLFDAIDLGAYISRLQAELKNPEFTECFHKCNFIVHEAAVLLEDTRKGVS